LRDQVINIYKRNIKKEDIPAVTQLFTTQWVVKYMVENSLGRYWLERNPNSKLKEKMKYLMPGEIEHIEERISPKDIKVFDNAMGSGHILIYAFEILMEIYLEEGYTESEAAESIIENNLYGLDIDKRAYQLAYFALMMKGRQYSRRILNKNIENNLRVFEDSTDINEEHLNYMGISMSEQEKKKAKKDIQYLIKEFENAKELGSILKLKKLDVELLRRFVNDTETEGQITFTDKNIEKTKVKLNNILDIAEMLNNKYDVMITNPPYLNKMPKRLKEYVWNNHSDYKNDLFAVFIYNNVEMCKKGGYSAYMTPNVWMFIKSYEKLREYLITSKYLDSLVQIAKGSFYSEATVDVITFIIKNERSNKKGKYIRLENFKGGMEVQRVKTLEAIENPDCEYYYETSQDNFELIPGSPIAYWASEKVYEIFNKEITLESYSDIRLGLSPGRTEHFLRLWYEVGCFFKENLGLTREKAKESKLKWFPCNKGGTFKKWYGNNDFVINWYDDGKEILNYSKSAVPNRELFFTPALTWTYITSGKFSMRYLGNDFLYNNKGPACFFKNKDYLFYILGLANTKIIDNILIFLAPTLDFKPGNIKNIPVIYEEKILETVISIVNDNLSISKNDWNSYETSWDFSKHPLLKFPSNTIR
ncbi:MAG: BREX-1 system adenine-specific DNA-methyltransferase PglX, partial [Tissierellales bacterium]